MDHVCVSSTSQRCNDSPCEKRADILWRGVPNYYKWTNEHILNVILKSFSIHIMFDCHVFGLHSDKVAKVIHGQWL